MTTPFTLRTSGAGVLTVPGPAGQPPATSYQPVLLAEKGVSCCTPNECLSNHCLRTDYWLSQVCCTSPFCVHKQASIFCGGACAVCARTHVCLLIPPFGVTTSLRHKTPSPNPGTARIPGTVEKLETWEPQHMQNLGNVRQVRTPTTARG